MQGLNFLNKAVIFTRSKKLSWISHEKWNFFGSYKDRKTMLKQILSLCD